MSSQAQESDVVSSRVVEPFCIVEEADWSLQRKSNALLETDISSAMEKLVSQLHLQRDRESLMDTSSR